jgi:5'-methylthioadenosine phosphorylase
MFSNFADIVGMTLVPEVVLARELGLCFASLCVVCNMAAGLQQTLSTEEISQIIKEKEPLVSHVISDTINHLNDDKPCSCPCDSSKAKL